MMAQIVASLYPVQFMDLVMMKPAYYACIVLEFCGITNFCWVLAPGLTGLHLPDEEGAGGTYHC